MKLVSAVAVAIACQLMTALPLTPVDAQSSTATDKERSIAFGDTQIVLHAPSQHCLLDPSQSADQRLAAHFFQPRAGTLNTYLGAFLDCKSLAALRSSGPNQVLIWPSRPEPQIQSQRHATSFFSEFAKTLAPKTAPWTWPSRTQGARSRSG